MCKGFIFHKFGYIGLYTNTTNLAEVPGDGSLTKYVEDDSCEVHHLCFVDSFRSFFLQIVLQLTHPYLHIAVELEQCVCVCVGDESKVE